MIQILNAYFFAEHNQDKVWAKIGSGVKSPHEGTRFNLIAVNDYELIEENDNAK